MDMHIPMTEEHSTPCDINRVELTGVIIMPPELFTDPYGSLIASVLISSRSQSQMAMWGTYGQQCYLFTVIALGAAGEKLATMQRGTVIAVYGSLDYAYDPSAKSAETRWKEAVRAETIEILQLPGPHWKD